MLRASRGSRSTDGKINWIDFAVLYRKALSHLTFHELTQRWILNQVKCWGREVIKILYSIAKPRLQCNICWMCNAIWTIVWIRLSSETKYSQTHLSRASSGERKGTNVHIVWNVFLNLYRKLVQICDPNYNLRTIYSGSIIFANR